MQDRHAFLKLGGLDVYVGSESKTLEMQRRLLPRAPVEQFANRPIPNANHAPNRCKLHRRKKRLRRPKNLD